MGMIAFSIFIALAIGLCLTWLYTENYRSSLLTANLTRTNAYTGANAAIIVNTVVNTGLTNTLRDIGFGYATLKLFWLVSDQNVTLSVNAASTGSPIKIINFSAGVPYVWTNDGTGGSVVSDVQTMSSVSSPSGTFTLTFTLPNGAVATTAAITYSGTIGTLLTNVRNAVYAVVGSANVVVTDNPGPDTIIFTFSGAWTGPQPLIAVGNGGLSGGTMAMAHTTTGSGQSYVPNPFAQDVTGFYWTNASGTNASIQGEVVY